MPQLLTRVLHALACTRVSSGSRLRRLRSHLEQPRRHRRNRAARQTHRIADLRLLVQRGPKGIRRFDQSVLNIEDSKRNAVHAAREYGGDRNNTHLPFGTDEQLARGKAFAPRD